MPKKKLTEEEKIQNGVDKVNRMNAFFDKMWLPVLFFVVATVFVFGALPKLMDMAGVSDGSDYGDLPSQESTLPDFYELRAAYMGEMDSHKDELTAAGYEFSDDYGETKCVILSKDDTVIYEFFDSMGSYSIIRKTAPEGSEYSALSLVVQSKRLIIAEIKLSDGSKLSASFKNEQFTPDLLSLSASDTPSDVQKVLSYVSAEELSAMLTQYKADLMKLID